MFRSALIGSAILFLSFNFMFADTIKGKVIAVDDEKRTVTIQVDGKESIFGLTKEAKIYTTGKAKKGTPPPEIVITLSAVTGKDVTATTDKVDGKDVVSQIKVDMAKKKKKGT